MTTASSKLLGAVIRVVKREAACWKAAGGSAGAGRVEGTAFSTNANSVREAKDEAEGELQRLLNSGLHPLSIKGETLAVLLTGTVVLFKCLCDRDALDAVAPPQLAASATLAVLNLIHPVVRGFSEAAEFQISTGGNIACKAIDAASSLFLRAEHTDEEYAQKMAALIEYFVDEVCEKAWGVKDAWGDWEFGDDISSPLLAAASAGYLPLVRTVFNNAKTANVGMAALGAFTKGHPVVFNFLIASERCLGSEEWPIVGSLFLLLGQGGAAATVEKREDMLEGFLRSWPQAVEVVWPWHEGMCRRVLEAAICVRSVKLVSTAVELGARIRYDRSDVVLSGKTFVSVPTMFFALRYLTLPIMKLLVEKGAFENWRVKYSKAALQILGSGLAYGLESCYPRLTPPGPHAEPSHRVDGLETLSLVFSTGFCYSWMYDGTDLPRNTCIHALTRQERLVFTEEQIVDLFSRCHDAGMDVLHIVEADVGKPRSITLAGMAAQSGLNKLLDFAVAVQGREWVEDWWEGWRTRMSSATAKTTPLLEAIAHRHLSTVQHLLRVHKAKAAYRGLGVKPSEQPIMQALALKDESYSLAVVQELIAADPLLCDLDCFRSDSPLNPVALCCAKPLPKCLEALLAANLPGVKEMCSRAVRVSDGSGLTNSTTPALMLANYRHWDELSMLFRYYPEVPLTTPGRVMRADGTVALQLLSVLETVELNGAPRSLLLQLKALAQQQQTGAEKAKVAAAKSAMPSNAFEVPVPKVLTEAEEKKKAKKREQKRKAKAKKRAAAAATKGEGNAGAGKEEGEASSSDTDSSGPDAEEEGMDEEEKMLARAPSFDLAKEKAARAARAEAEKKLETKE
jgi:hypothetical protein